MADVNEMDLFPFSREHLIRAAQFSDRDVEKIKQCRQNYTQLGFGYQLAFVRIFNMFPAQKPLSMIDEIIVFVSLQLKIDKHNIHSYERRRKTISEHQEMIRSYLGLRLFHSASLEVDKFLLKESYTLEHTGALMARLKDFLRQRQVLEPSRDTMSRAIQTQREAARTVIYDKISVLLNTDIQQSLDAIIVTNTDHATYSPLYYLKQPPGNPSPTSFVKLTGILDQIKTSGVLQVDLSWLNNNFQRSLARYARQCTIYRLRRLKDARRYTVLICFLHQLYQDTFDAAVQMHDKLMNKVYNKAGKEIDSYMKARRKHIHASLIHYREILGVVLNGDIEPEAVKTAIFQAVDEETLKIEINEIDGILSNKYSDSFKQVIARFSYIRQFSPALLKHIAFQVETQDKASDSLVEAAKLLNQMNRNGKHKLPEGAPVDFIPKKLRSFVFQNGKPQKPAWECALLTVLRDQIKSGNLSVSGSKRFANLETFFVPKPNWAAKREAFFTRAGLPSNPKEVAAYLTYRLNQAYDRFFERQPENHYAQLDEKGWKISSDPTEKLDYGTDSALNPLKEWISEHIRTIKLPDLLIEVDNDLHFSRCFMPMAQQDHPDPQQVCEVLATVMAHASEVGPYTMSQMIEGISYDRMKHITDWHLHEEAQRDALARLVNAIGQLDITKAWGDGTTSSSDGQRFSLHRKVLQKSYSHAFNDFALEFYHFVADNYAPYFSLTHECSDRDAPFVLDGLLYNESDLNIEEHYTDTHGFTDINFAAFTMFGKRFVPRIKGLKNKAIFYIDTGKNYGSLSLLLEKKNRILHPEWIAEQWDRMGHFYASLESGHVTASTALRRLNGFSGKNHFYRANREFGRVIRTEYTLNFMSDPAMRKRNRRGLLKGEQIHAMARDIKYGHQGRLHARDALQLKHSCSCLTLVIASIIYWQAKEIHRIIQAHELPKHIDIALLSNISPVSWKNVILYGDYVLNRYKVVS